ncbi:MAG: DUF721 domain-containing protein [Desulfuromonadaceae bacterium]|nr:DUF721 domain-containing protein [Desulfuromonadaceae bacterium]MDD2856058.1 DUF721 domain-containing protein [Desulfuromonadaceae bacterium]
MQKRPRMPFPCHLSRIVRDNLAGAGLSATLQEAEIWRVWPDVVGDTLSSRAQPLRIINGTLTVAVSSAPWMQELRFMTALLKEKLNNSLGGEVVREIVLKTGRLNIPEIEKEDKVLPCRTLKPQELAWIEEQSAPIEDLETRLAFMDLLKVSLEKKV